MKTKLALFGFVLLVLAAVCVPFYNKYKSTPPSPPVAVTKSGLDRSPAGLPGHGKSKRTREGLNDPPIANLGDKDLLKNQIYLMVNDAERLNAIREALGINISDEAYQKAIKDYGYQVNPVSFWLSLCSAWMDEDPRAVMAWLITLPGKNGEGLNRYFLNYWLKIDAPAALIYAKEQEMSPAAIAQLERIAEEWKSQVSPMSVTAFAEMMRNKLEANPDIKFHRRDFMESIGKWAGQDPKSAAEFALSLDESIKKEIPLLTEAVKLWAQSDPDAALAWAKGLQNDTERYDAIAATLRSWQLKHRDQVVDLSDLPESMHREIIGNIVEDRASINPEATMEYVINLEDKEFRNKTMSIVATAWVYEDLNAAEQWVEGLPQGELRDTALEAIVEPLTWGGKKFESAASLARQIQDTELRRRVSRKVIFSGLEENLSGALALAGELPQIHYFEVTGWANSVKNYYPAGSPEFQSWLENAYSGGRLRLGPGGIQPGPYGDTSKNLSASEQENVKISKLQYDKLLEIIRPETPTK